MLVHGIKPPDSERSDFFLIFVSVYSITSRNNAPISNFGGGFRCNSEYPWCIIEKNWNFYAKPDFD
ncbi:Uncharacterized protein FWK35_00004013 [Aphis craccivora]|uniref:Uncharacterized protein n=1 Tax=Aphis craccivora TaxID=307492 RepID=A0A6G0Z210_APHCR|nr:Uncharacterized protein FWK35_00004013 [Aphis craccivora]